MSMCPGTRGWQLHHRTLTQVPGLTSRPYNSRLQRKAIQAKAMKGAASYAALANELADAAAEVIRPYFRSTLPVDQKADLSPVTQADRAAEQAMRELITARCPHHDILGEEFGLHQGTPAESEEDRGYRWVLDPIDGTRAFITGKPTFGTLIALLHRGVPVVGVIDQPISRERWVGVKHEQSTLNGQPITCRPCSSLSRAYLQATSPHMFREGEQEQAFARVRDKVLMPLYGCDCYAYGLLAMGFVDLVVEATMQPYDYLALVPIIEGAGGVITDWEGKTLHWPMTPSNDYILEPLAGEVLAAGDGAAHAQALALLSNSSPASSS